MEEKYGEWTVLGPSPDKKYYSKCQCSCGVIKDVHNSALRLGKSTSCGHFNAKIRRENRYQESDKKIIGKRFGRLIALKRINIQGISRYLCECDCGNEIEVKGILLLTGGVSSCGCLRKDKSAKSMDGIMQIGHEKLNEGRIDGTVVYQLEEKLSKNSTTGIKGVSKYSNGKYRAYINLKRKQIHLGTFDTIEEAKAARLQAEEDLYKPILKKHDNSNKRKSPIE